MKNQIRNKELRSDLNFHLNKLDLNSLITESHPLNAYILRINDKLYNYNNKLDAEMDLKRIIALTVSYLP